jgi:anti-sigma28 factor (negative regulator of flagellin synthesis)
MRIEDYSLIDRAAAGAAKTEKTLVNARAEDRTSESGDGDRVTVSGLAARLANAANMADAARENRVSALAAQFHAGEYQIDPDRISRAIVSDMLGGR